MADSAQQSGAGSVKIPADAQTKFGPLVQLILESESMNNEERQYWMNILPVMTPEQIQNLEEILTNEKNQLAAIDAKYTGSSSAETAPQKKVEDIAAERKNKREQRVKAEREHQDNEVLTEESILKNIQNM
ncbi:MAG: hypothetical protein KBD00_02365 [Candidatus Peribacteraceae bacterium]|nr:hypothetical protein [Candidatus Peribacteraceae bacterium]